MTQQIGTTMVSDDLHAFAKSICARGGKVFLSKMAEDHTGTQPSTGCTNCNGGGRLMVEYLVTAVGETPMTVQAGSDAANKNPVTSILVRNEWAGKRMKSFPCPVCTKQIKTERDIKF